MTSRQSATPGPAAEPKPSGVGQFGVLLRSTAWISGTRMAVRVLGLVNTAIVARLLTPSDYGVVALGMAVWALMAAFTNFDTDAYIVRAKSVSRAEFDAAWTLNLLTGGLVAALIGLGGPWLAAFLGDQRLVPIFYIIAGVVLMASLKNPAFLTYNRRQDFSRESLVQVSGKVLSVAVTIYFAFKLESFYALIIGIAFSYSWTTIGTYVLWPYLPRINLRDMRDVFHFGVWLTAAKALNTVSTKLDAFILQKIIGPAAVGLYSVAKETTAMVEEQLMMPVRRAVLPAMARAQDDIAELRRLYVESLAAVFAVVGPFAVGMALVASDFVALLLGAQWVDAVPLLQILAINLALHLFTANYQVVFMSLGQTKQFFYRSAVFFALRPAGFIGGALWGGLEGAVWGALLANLLVRLVELYLVKRLIDLPIGPTIWACNRSLGALAMMAAAVLGLELVLPSGTGEGLAMLRLLAQAALGAVVYTGVHLGLWYGAGKPLGIESRFIDLAKRKLGRNT